MTFYKTARVLEISDGFYEIVIGKYLQELVSLTSYFYLWKWKNVLKWPHSRENCYNSLLDTLLLCYIFSYGGFKFFLFKKNVLYFCLLYFWVLGLIFFPQTTWDTTTRIVRLNPVKFCWWQTTKFKLKIRFFIVYAIYWIISPKTIIRKLVQ